MEAEKIILRCTIGEHGMRNYCHKGIRTTYYCSRACNLCRRYQWWQQPRGYQTRSCHWRICPWCRSCVVQHGLSEALSRNPQEDRGLRQNRQTVVNTSKNCLQTVKRIKGRTTSFGVAILGGTRPPSWRRMSEACMMIRVNKGRAGSGVTILLFGFLWPTVSSIAVPRDDFLFLLFSASHCKDSGTSKTMNTSPYTEKSFYGEELCEKIAWHS